MKKRLSFLLALALVLTLTALSFIPAAAAAAIPVIAEDAAPLTHNAGISLTTLFSLLGLAMLSMGGTVFSILKRKHHRKSI